MRGIAWAAVAVVGMAMMQCSYLAGRVDTVPAWGRAAMFVGRGEPATPLEGLDCVGVRLRLLPFPARPHRSVRTVPGLTASAGEFYRLSVQEKLIQHPRLADDITDDMLASGRLPASGKDEVVAGYYASQADELTVAGRTLEVVGVLQEGVALFLDSYLTASGGDADLFDPADRDVREAHIVRLPEGDEAAAQVHARSTEAFPWGQFVAWSAQARMDPAFFYLYVSGTALLCVGGSALFILLYRRLASVAAPGFIRAPLAEIDRRRRLFAAVHVIYFGTCVLFMISARLLPEVTAFLRAAVVEAIRGGSSPLAFAAEAYIDKNIPLAAFRTVVVNFTVGSLAFVTLPSVILPGIGALLLLIRPVSWGLLLAPTTVAVSRAMVPHSITMVLEGEGYVLAAFFAALIPIYLFSHREGPSVVRRYGRALLLNLKGNLLVLGVLAVAAVYEAIEVILMS